MGEGEPGELYHRIWLKLKSEVVVPFHRSSVVTVVQRVEVDMERGENVVGEVVGGKERGYQILRRLRV